MTVKVIWFASARRKDGPREEPVELPEGATVAVLGEHIARLRPEIAGLLERSRMAVNESYANPDETLTDGDEVAVIPPVAGGSNR